MARRGNKSSAQKTSDEFGQGATPGDGLPATASQPCCPHNLVDSDNEKENNNNTYNDNDDNDSDDDYDDDEFPPLSLPALRQLKPGARNPAKAKDARPKAEKVKASEKESLRTIILGEATPHTEKNLDADD